VEAGVTVSAPPRPPTPPGTAPDSEPLDHEQIKALVEALIEEARRETRRRHRRYWALAVLVAVVGVVVLVLLGGGAASQTAAPAVSAQWNAAARVGTSRIVFVRGHLVDGGVGPPCRRLSACDNELYVMNADGTGLRRLTRHAALGGGYSTNPVWSPDGRKLVFVKRVERGGAPCSPASCDYEIYVMNADGTGLRRLTRNAVPDGTPAWLPDGRRIGFVRSIPRRNGGSSRDAIYVINADGSDERRLTLLPRDAGVPGGAPGGDLTWSPDGEKVAFVALANAGSPDIFVMNADGSRLRNVTNTVTTSFDVTWSPDGQRIAYLEGRTDGAPLTVANADGTGKQRLTGPLMVDLGSPSWSPDGRTLAFTGGSGGAGAVIYTVHADGSGLRKLTHGPGWSLFPQWSPDGRRILFVSYRDDLVHRETDLFVMNADGSGQRNLTRTRGVSELFASWAPS
jgi:Tol biopolymer transport system component